MFPRFFFLENSLYTKNIYNGKECISVFWGFGMRKVETKIYSFSNHPKCNYSIGVYGQMGATSKTYTQSKGN